ncbi:MAG: RdgB/HAM1 family non-canonical purine NTP pyrophosphatase [Bacteroidota bacterium]
MPQTINLLSLYDVNYTHEIEETAETIEGNALLKAQTIALNFNTNCFADDSGLLVDALNGAPGVYSARYAGEQKNDHDNIEKLLGELKGNETRKAYFKTVMALVLDNKEYIFEGTVNGTITHAKQGTNGFGYDPVFMPDGYTKTFAEMSFEEKNHMSHRKIALKKLLDFLSTVK